MKWKVRKNTVAALMAILFAVPAVAAAAVTVRWNGGPELFLPQTWPLIPLICTAVSVLAGLMLMMVCILFRCGKAPGTLVLAAVSMVLATGSVFAADLFDTLYVRQTAFYPFSAEHLAPAYALGLLLIVLLTASRVIRHSAWNVICAVLVTVVYLVGCITELGVTTEGYSMNLSAMVLFSSYAVCIALCSTALVRVRTRKKRPVRQPAQDWVVQNVIPVAETEPQPMPAKHFEAMIPDMTEPQPVAEPAPEPEIPSTEPVPEEKPAEAPKRTMLPKPEPDCVWQWIGTEPDGTFIYQQRRIAVIRETGERVPGPMLPLFYPHTPRFVPPPRQNG